MRLARTDWRRHGRTVCGRLGLRTAIRAGALPAARPDMANRRRIRGAGDNSLASTKCRPRSHRHGQRSIRTRRRAPRRRLPPRQRTAIFLAPLSRDVCHGGPPPRLRSTGHCSMKSTVGAARRRWTRGETTAIVEATLRARDDATYASSMPIRLNQPHDWVDKVTDIPTQDHNAPIRLNQDQPRIILRRRGPPARLGPTLDRLVHGRRRRGRGCVREQPPSPSRVLRGARATPDAARPQSRTAPGMHRFYAADHDWRADASTAARGAAPASRLDARLRERRCGAHHRRGRGRLATVAVGAFCMRYRRKPPSHTWYDETPGRPIEPLEQPGRSGRGDPRGRPGRCRGQILGRAADAGRADPTAHVQAAFRRPAPGETMAEPSRRLPHSTEPVPTTERRRIAHELITTGRARTAGGHGDRRTPAQRRNRTRRQAASRRNSHSTEVCAFSCFSRQLRSF